MELLSAIGAILSDNMLTQALLDIFHLVMITLMCCTAGILVLMAIILFLEEINNRS